MDQIYQAVKGFLKSVVNLFVAAIGNSVYNGKDQTPGIQALQ